MLLTVQQSDLESAFSIAIHAVDSRPFLPVLSYFLIEAKDDNTLHVSATDLNVHITTWIPADIERYGSATIHAKTAHELIKSLGDGEIKFELNDTSLEIKSHMHKSHLRCLPAEGYPPMSIKHKPQHDFSVNGDEFKRVINQCAHSVAKEAIRPILQGVYLHLCGNTLTLASSDGYRLTENKIWIETKFEDPISMIIPINSLLSVTRSLGVDSKVGIALPGDGNTFTASFDSTLISAYLLEGEYPQYHQLIHTSSSTVADAHADELIPLLRQAKIFSRDDAYSVTLTFQPGHPGLIHVQSKSENIGSSRGKVNAEVNGDAVEININVVYLLLLLRLFPQEKIRFQLINGESSALVTIPLEDTFKYVVMPIS